MNWFNTLKVKTKLIGGFLIVSIIAAIIGAVGIRSTQQINEMARQMYDIELKGLRHASLADQQIIAMGRAVRSTLLTTTNDAYQKEYSAIDKHVDAAKLELESLFKLATREGDVSEIESALSAIVTYDFAVKSLVQEQPSETLGRLDTTKRLFDEIRPLGEAAEHLLEQLIVSREGNAKQFADNIESIYGDTLNIMIGLTLGGVLIAIALGTLLTRGLTRQLGGEPSEVAQVAGDIAKGNLSSQIDVRKAPQGSVIHAMQAMQESLRTIVATVRGSSDHIAAGSQQIAAGNADLSQRTEEQAANLTETAAAMDELSSTVQNNSDVAKQAVQVATSASEAAVQGGEVVSDVVSTMGEINASSRKIVDIIGVIDSIAFQTNILALNAAVEAARAGEQGRGFAVVASEVRSLAQKSASAAKDIKGLIDDSVQKVSTGTTMADAAGEAMQNIVQQVRRVTDLINEISAATNEQTSGLAQINEAITQLSDVTQQNASLVEESAAAADSLSDQAQQLVKAVGVFKLRERTGSHASPSRPVERTTDTGQQQATSIPALALNNPLLRPPQASAKAVPSEHKPGLPTSKEDDWEEF